MGESAEKMEGIRVAADDGAAQRRARRAKNLRRCPTCGERFPPDFAVCPRDATPLGVGATGGDPLMGAVLAGSYRITRLLAKGGMGRLYEAEHTRLPRRFAIKVIHDCYAQNADAVARFEREARAAASICSDHVLDVVDVVRTADDRPCIVAERLEGEDLQARLERRGRMPLAEAVQVARQLCHALAAAHAVGVVHRDLKPSNVFLAASAHGREVVKILDFGVAKLVGSPEITRDGAVVGTPAYMAPEQARGAAHVDGRADVYGVGAVLYRMLTGHAPFEAQDATASLTRLLNDDLVPASAYARQLPEDAEDLLAATLSRDPADRPPDVMALDRALACFDPRDTSDPAAATAAEPLRPPEGSDADSTLVLPRGSVDGARLAARRLRHARPLAVLATAAAAFGGALGTGALLAAAVRAIRDLPALAGVEHVLVTLGALAAGAGVATGLGRVLRSRWGDPTAVRALADTTARALVAGVATLGLGAVVLRGAATLLEGGRAAAPAAEAIGFALALGVSTVLLALRLPRQ